MDLEFLQHYSQADQWDMLMFLYESALKEISTKIEILNAEFMRTHNYNPIEHITSRIKTSESIAKKLKKNGFDVTIENMVLNVSDIAGIRVITSFTPDIYNVAEMLAKQDDINVILVKDYIKHPKENGYKSYHMVVEVPIFLSGGPVPVRAEVQIRTIAMDFWASLEHKIYYKFEGHAPSSISEDLKECADIVDMLDHRMLQLNEAIMRIKQDGAEGVQEEPDREA